MRLRKIKPVRLLLFLLLLGCLSSLVSAATVHGQVYEWYSLEELNGVIIDVNSVPAQRYVSQAGGYLFSLPPGSYHLSAKYYSGNTLAYTAEEDITIASEGEFVLDLIMFPLFEEKEDELASLETGLGEASLPKEEAKAMAEERKPFALELVLIVLGLAMALALLTYHFYRPPKELGKGLPRKAQGKAKPSTRKSLAKPPAKKSSKPKPTAKAEALKGLDKYALEVVGALQRSGNRLTQKELRQKVSVGEAKVSLIVSELEALGLVKKIKQGRGNIVVLQKERLK